MTLSGQADTPNLFCQDRMCMNASCAHPHCTHTMDSFHLLSLPLFSESSNSIARQREASPGWQEEQSQEQGHSAALGRKAPFPARVAPGTRGERYGSAGGEILSSLQKALLEAPKPLEELGRVRGGTQCLVSRAVMGSRPPWTLAGPLALSSLITHLPFSLRGVCSP